MVGMCAYLLSVYNLRLCDVYFFVATANNTPKTIPKRAANNTRCSVGSKKVMVCAGYQKKGMVFLKTNPHCLFQSICAKRSAIGIGVINDLRLPPCMAICASVILWKVINTGANMVFIAIETASATHNLLRVKSAFVKLVIASVIPKYSMSMGVPFEKIIIAALIPIPKNPQTITRGKSPKDFGIYFPLLRRQPNISPRVDNTPNFIKLITMPCSALKVL